jgi:hypothetical protein
MKKHLLNLGLSLLFLFSYAVKAQTVSPDVETLVPGPLMPATPPKSAEDVRMRVEQLQALTKPVQEAYDAMRRISKAYEQQVIQALDNPVSEIDEKIDAARTAWLEGIGRESSRVEALLIPVLTTAKGLSSWATVKLRTLEVTLNRRIRESQRNGDNNVQLTASELNDLEALDALGIEKDVVGRETRMSIDRLERVLLELEADRDELQATAAKFEKVRLLYGGLGRGMRGAAIIQGEDQIHQREGKEFAKSVTILRNTHDDATQKLQELLYQVNVYFTGTSRKSSNDRKGAQ